MGVAKLTDSNTVVPNSKYARVERELRYLLPDLPEGLAKVIHKALAREPGDRFADAEAFRQALVPFAT